ncbi:MAG: sigma factor-like helix-turn-helix DNA-binding protein [Syntrophobacteraceae bacterium]
MWERLEAQGTEASPELLSRRFDVEESEIVEMDRRLNGGEVSLDSPLTKDSEETYKSFLPSNDLPVDDQIADREAKAILHDKLMLFGEQLRGKDAAIFDKRLLGREPMTLQQVGDKYGISRERVRQLESRLKKKLKAYLEEEITDIDLLQENMIEM